MSRTVIDAYPTLAGEVLAVTAERVLEVARDLAHAQQLRAGVRRQGLYRGDGYPDRAVSWRWEIEWSHLRSSRTLLSAILATGGVYTWTPWRPVELAYSGDNARADFVTPWRHAPFTGEPLPSDDPTGVHLGWLAASDPAFLSPLTVVEKTAAEYDAGSPTAELWVDTGATRWKVDPVPGLGEVIYVSMIPQFDVVEVPHAQGEEIGRRRTPRRLILAEAG